MQPQTVGRLAERRAGSAEPGLDMRFHGRYLSLTSFRRDGTGVATPEWFVIENGRLLVITDPQSFKAERIRRNAGLMIAPCTATGRPGSEPLPARAELPPQRELGHAKEMLARKYRIDTFLILPRYRAVRRLRGAHEGTAEIVLAITPTAAASGPKFSEDSS